MDSSPSNEKHDAGWRAAIRFWEPRRLWYNAVLFAIVMLWVVLTWPHFRAALNWLDFGRMCVLALLANVCYCAAYVAEFFMQGAIPLTYWRRVRYAIWILGMVIAVVLSNYWIADEIYPDFAQGAGPVAATMNSIGGGSNMNFPAPLAVVGFLAACGGVFVALAATVIFWFARKPRFVRVAGIAIGIGAVIYFGLLVGFSEASHDTALGLGQEKYFCEIDCHLAYAVVDVKNQTADEWKDYVITLRTRFDEKTISPKRAKDAPLMPSPRGARIIDRLGHTYEPVSTAGSSLMTPLRPGEAFTTELEFRVPKDATGLRLLINTIPGWPDRLVIGDENSWLHKKTYFAL
jgi:hypothetical protein